MHCPACHKDNPPGATVCEFCRTPLPDPSSRFQATVPVSGISIGDQSFAVGGLIAGRYLVERELGRGGMGVVYLVKDQKLHGKEVALKLISADLTDSHQGQERFVQEVLAAQELQHANIVRVFHLDEVAGQSFFTMEYVPGRSLREVVEERKRQGQTFSLKECAAVLMPVLKALHHAHTQNPPVIHRDIKPDNIIVTGDFPTPQVKVLDFGLAKMLSPSKLTTTAMTMGTAYYMAPEQVKGAKDIDQRADLFSVGVVFYEMLTGEVPSGRFKLPAEMNPELPAKIDDLMDTVLQQHPKDRYASAREFAGALESVVQTADENARRKEREAAEAEMRKQREAEETVQRQAEAEARRVAQEEARRKAEEEARQKVEEAKVKAAEEIRRQAEQDAKRKGEEEARLKAEAEAKRKAADETRRRQLEAERLEEQEDARRKAEAESRRRKMFFAVGGVVAAVLAFVVLYDMGEFRKLVDPPQVATQQSTSPAISPQTTPQAQAPASKQYSLTIRPEPSDAQVKILNIKPKYQDGIKLEAGQYKIEVSKLGYKTLRGTIDVVDRDVVAKAELEKEPEVAQAPAPSPRPSVSSKGDTWRDSVTGMEFVWVPGGCYQMGSNFAPLDERPVHEVCVDGFWMARNEVTQAEWQRVMGNNPSKFKGDRNPVEQVSWNDAQEFIGKLNAGGSGRFHLPTEAEWEYAARSGGRNEKYAGGDDVDRVAWYWGNSGSKTHSVGTKAPNGLGLYDMSGNVWEWCQDLYDESAYSKHSRNNPVVSSGGPGRVIRSGGWEIGPNDVRAAMRYRAGPSYRLSYLGFRLVRTE